MSNHKANAMARILRFGLRGLVLVLPVFVAFVLLNTRPRFANLQIESDLGSSKINFGPDIPEDTEYGWPSTFVDVHYTIRPTLTIDFDDFWLPHYQFRWLSLLSNMLMFIAATVAIYTLCYVASRSMAGQIATTQRRTGEFGA